MTKTEKDMQGETMRVLVAIDGSEPAGVAVDLVSDVSWPAGTEILVAEAVESGAGLFGGPWPALALAQADSLEAEIRAEAERTVQEARGRLVRPGLSVEAIVLRGRPATAIVDRARDMRADLIVLGSRGHGTIETMLLGSVSAEVVDHAPTPVLVSRDRQIKRVMLAWDGSSCASRAADLLRTWSIFAGSSVRVVSVADIEVPWWIGFPEPGSPGLMPIYLEAADASRRQHDQLAREMTAQLQAAGLSAEADRRAGDAATEILAAARASNAELIVMGTHGRTGLKRLVLGSVARNILQHATCSVLIVHEGSSQALAPGMAKTHRPKGR
ncbi:MAG: universal stress protein [Candidatus Limnocylindrales bacterium]|nr:universal stress protein [Candidatus Limnocylindrales bacterium]